jgi:phosphorylcholine metabolism protein LicD
MTIPSIFIHCYDFGSNLCPTTSLYEKLFEVEKVNPYKNIWKTYPKQEKEVLEMLEHIGDIFDKNNIKYSLIYGSMLGYARNKKFISYDDDIDIIIHKKDLEKFEMIKKEIIDEKIANIFTYKTPILKSSLYYKLYPINHTISIESIEHKIKEIISGERYDYKWPFIDVFIYDLDENDKMIDIALNKTFDVSDETIPIVITSYNDMKTYRSRIFKEYEKIVDQTYKNWRNICFTSDWNHTKEESILTQCSFSCKNVNPDYDKNNDTHPNEYYSNSILENRKYYILIVGIFSIILLFTICHLKNWKVMIPLLLFELSLIFLFLFNYDYIMVYIKKGCTKIVT